MKRTCTHCGKEIDAANTFCPYCGMKTEAQEQKEDTRTDGMEVATAMAVEQPGQRKPGKTKAGILTAVFAAVCLCIFLYIRSLPVTLDLNDYGWIAHTGHGAVILNKAEYKLCDLLWGERYEVFWQCQHNKSRTKREQESNPIPWKPFSCRFLLVCRLLDNFLRRLYSAR